MRWPFAAGFAAGVVVSVIVVALMLGVQLDAIPRTADHDGPEPPAV